MAIMKIEVTPRQAELIEKILDSKLISMSKGNANFYYVGDTVPDFSVAEIKELYNKVVRASN